MGRTVSQSYYLFFAFQMPNLEIYGPSLTKLCLSECEFVHPQTLNPLARCCPNLVNLTLENPTTVPDDLFVGEVAWAFLIFFPITLICRDLWFIFKFHLAPGFVSKRLRSIFNKNKHSTIFTIKVQLNKNPAAAV